MSIYIHNDAICLLETEVKYLESSIDSSYNKSEDNMRNGNDKSIENSLFEERESIKEKIELIENSIAVLKRLG